MRAAVLHKETDPATGNTVASLDPKKSSLGATRVCIGHEIGLGTYAVQAFRPVTGKPGSEELVGSVEKVRLQELADTIMRVAGIRPQE